MTGEISPEKPRQFLEAKLRSTPGAMEAFQKLSGKCDPDILAGLCYLIMRREPTTLPLPNGERQDRGSTRRRKRRSPGTITNLEKDGAVFARSVVERTRAAKKGVKVSPQFRQLEDVLEGRHPVTIYDRPLDSWDSATGGLDLDDLRKIARVAAKLWSKVRPLRRSPLVQFLIQIGELPRSSDDVLTGLPGCGDPFRGLKELPELAKSGEGRDRSRTLRDC